MTARLTPPSHLRAGQEARGVHDIPRQITACFMPAFSSVGQSRAREAWGAAAAAEMKMKMSDRAPLSGTDEHRPSLHCAGSSFTLAFVYICPATPCHTAMSAVHDPATNTLMHCCLLMFFLLSYRFNQSSVSFFLCFFFLRWARFSRTTTCECRARRQHRRQQPRPQPVRRQRRQERLLAPHYRPRLHSLAPASLTASMPLWPTTPTSRSPLSTLISPQTTTTTATAMAMAVAMLADMQAAALPQPAARPTGPAAWHSWRYAEPASDSLSLFLSLPFSLPACLPLWRENVVRVCGVTSAQLNSKVLSLSLTLLSLAPGPVLD